MLLNKSGVFRGREKGEERVYGQEENGVFVKKEMNPLKVG